MEGPKKRYPGLSPASTEEAPRESFARETSVISRKELARELRKQAYQRAKQARATDPRHLAMKEAAKVRRREVYQQVKEKRKGHEAELKARRKVADAAARVENQRQLADRVRGALHGGAIIPSVTSAGSAEGDESYTAEHHEPAPSLATVPGEASKRGRASTRGSRASTGDSRASTGDSRASTRGNSSVADVAFGQEGGSSGNADWARSGVAREVAEALEDPNIKDLMARLRAESVRLAELAAQQQSTPAGVEEVGSPSDSRPETCL